MVKRLRVLLLGCSMAWACAPSHRMVHEGNVYFERCYGADFDQRVPPALREACWSAWLAHYTRKQPAHRIDYAMRRLEAIQAGDQTLSLPGLAGGESEPPLDLAADALVKKRGARAGAEMTVTGRVEQGVPHGCADACDRYGDACRARCPEDVFECRSLCVREAQICRGGCY